VRVLAGDVFYRDVHDIITPGSQYMMAGLFALFGASMTTARLTDAVVHGLIAALSFGAARALGTGRTLASIAGLAHLALFQTAWPYSSPHWISTCLTLLLFVLLLGGRTPVFVLGLLSGVMVMVQQQHGAVTAAGAVVILIVDHWLARRAAGGVPAAGVWRRLALFAAGGAAIVVPSFAALMAVAGPGPLIRSLILQPLMNYRATMSGVAWGAIGPMTRDLAAHNWPTLLAWLPIVLVLDVVRAIVAWRRCDLAAVRLRLIVVLSILFAALSIAYYCDFIHIGFIGALLAVAACENLDWALRSVPGPATGRRLLTGGLALAAMVTGVVHLEWYAAWRRTNYPVPQQTRFGYVDLSNAALAAQIREIAELLDRAPSRLLFCYPAYPALYLMVGAQNATPYQLLAPEYSPHEQLVEVVEILERRQVPYIAFVPILGPGTDPVRTYISRDFRPINRGGIKNSVWLMGRKTAVRPPDPERPVESSVR
jgi:hypothetical protein